MKTLSDAPLLSTVTIWKKEPTGFKFWAVKVVAKSATTVTVQCLATRLCYRKPATTKLAHR